MSAAPRHVVTSSLHGIYWFWGCNRGTSRSLTLWGGVSTTLFPHSAYLLSTRTVVSQRTIIRVIHGYDLHLRLRTSNRRQIFASRFAVYAEQSAICSARQHLVVEQVAIKTENASLKGLSLTSDLRRRCGVSVMLALSADVYRVTYLVITTMIIANFSYLTYIYCPVRGPEIVPCILQKNQEWWEWASRLKKLTIC